MVETFGDAAEWTDISGNEKFYGHDGVRTFYTNLFTGFPDFSLDVQQKYVTEEAILLEVVARGTHTGTWKGIPQTGKPIDFALCAIFTFDDEDKLREEKVYYDRLTVLTQLGVITLG